MRDWLCTQCGELTQHDFRTDDRGWSEALPPIRVGPDKCPVCSPRRRQRQVSEEDRDKAFRHIKDVLDEMAWSPWEKKKHYE